MEELKEMEMEMIEEETIEEENYDETDDLEEDSYDDDEEYEEDDEESERHISLKNILIGTGIVVGAGCAAHKIRNKIRISKGLEPKDSIIAALKKKRQAKKEAELNEIADRVALRMMANQIEEPEDSENETDESEG